MLRHFDVLETAGERHPNGAGLAGHTGRSHSHRTQVGIIPDRERLTPSRSLRAKAFWTPRKRSVRASERVVMKNAGFKSPADLIRWEVESRGRARENPPISLFW